MTLMMATTMMTGRRHRRRSCTDAAVPVVLGVLLLFMAAIAAAGSDETDAYVSGGSDNDNENVHGVGVGVGAHRMHIVGDGGGGSVLDERGVWIDKCRGMLMMGAYGDALGANTEQVGFDGDVSLPSSCDDRSASPAARNDDDDDDDDGDDECAISMALAPYNATEWHDSEWGVWPFPASVNGSHGVVTDDTYLRATIMEQWMFTLSTLGDFTEGSFKMFLYAEQEALLVALGALTTSSPPATNETTSSSSTSSSSLPSLAATEERTLTMKRKLVSDLIAVYDDAHVCPCLDSELGNATFYERGVPDCWGLYQYLEFGALFSGLLDADADGNGGGNDAAAAEAFGSRQQPDNNNNNNNDGDGDTDSDDDNDDGSSDRLAGDTLPQCTQIVGMFTLFKNLCHLDDAYGHDVTGLYAVAAALAFRADPFVAPSSSSSSGTGDNRATPPLRNFGQWWRRVVSHVLACVADDVDGDESNGQHTPPSPSRNAIQMTILEDSPDTPPRGTRDPEPSDAWLPLIARQFELRDAQGAEWRASGNVSVNNVCFAYKAEVYDAYPYPYATADPLAFFEQMSLYWSFCDGLYSSAANDSTTTMTTSSSRAPPQQQQLLESVYCPLAIARTCPGDTDTLASQMALILGAFYGVDVLEASSVPVFASDGSVEYINDDDDDDDDNDGTMAANFDALDAFMLEYLAYDVEQRSAALYGYVDARFAFRGDGSHHVTDS